MAAIVLAAILPAAGQGIPQQTGSQAETTTFSANVDLVMLRATVRDRKGRLVSGLTKQDFHVLEDGVPQSIRIFQHEDVPVAVGLVVDNSGSMSPKRRDVTAAALAFVRSSNPHDEMFIVNFNEHVFFGLPDTELFSASAPALVAALNGVPANGETALYDAIAAALERLKKATLDKKALIVISDGGDNASRHTLAQILESAGRSDAIVYTIGLFDAMDDDRNPGVLKKIARATGGEAYLPQEISDVTQICQRIAEDIRSQYTIGYAPTNQTFDGSYRTIRLTVTSPNGEKYTARTRAGYFASRQETGKIASGKLP